MKTYDDLSDYEKANLSSEEFERYLDIARMQSDIIVPDAPEDVTDVTDGIEMVTVFSVRTDHWTTLMRFSKREDAEAVLTLTPLKIEQDYQIGIPYINGAPQRLEVVAEQVATFESYQKNKPDVERRKALASERSSYIQRRNELIEEREKSLAGMRDDLARCKALAYQVGRVRQKLTEFLDLCEGDEAIARRFLAKHYSENDIALADSWPSENREAAE